MSEGWPKFVGFIFAAPSVDSIPEINPPQSHFLFANGMATNVALEIFYTK